MLTADFVAGNCISCTTATVELSHKADHCRRIIISSNSVAVSEAPAAAAAAVVKEAPEAPAALFTAGGRAPLMHLETGWWKPSEDFSRGHEVET